MIYDRKALLDRDNTRKREKKEIAQKRIPTDIKKVSDTLIVEQRIHAKLKRDYLMDHPFCECGRQGCDGKPSVDIHHKKGRGKWLNAVELFLAVSRICHIWIGENTAEAERLGLILTRHEKMRVKK